jgi:ABC-type polysaccharide/polyol phosphate export permease
MLTAWLYLTPVIYPNSILPEIYQRYLFLNPAYPILSLFRDPIYLGQIPDLNILLIAILTGCLSLLVGWWFFTRRADEIAYRI